MLPTNLISALQNLYGQAKTSSPTAANTKPQLPSLEVGQQLVATVQNQISEGVFKVQVAGQTMQMRLPNNVQQGSNVKLEVISTQPRITFGVIASSNPLATSEQIGSTARLLSGLAERPLEQSSLRQINQPAIWRASEQVPDTKQLAGALQTALTNSGLFYESHQAQWVRGERSTAQLMVEPQNQLTATTDITNKPSVGESGLPIARELVPMVQQQLHTLETHHLTWTGQVWPEQDMRWEIQEQAKSPNQYTSEHLWRTEMELDLPNLGNVQAQLAFNDTGLQLTLNAADQTTVDLFNRALPSLKVALNKADIQLLTVVVKGP